MTKYYLTLQFHLDSISTVSPQVSDFKTFELLLSSFLCPLSVLPLSFLSNYPLKKNIKNSTHSYE